MNPRGWDLAPLTLSDLLLFAEAFSRGSWWRYISLMSSYRLIAILSWDVFGGTNLRVLIELLALEIRTELECLAEASSSPPLA